MNYSKQGTIKGGMREEGMVGRKENESMEGAKEGRKIEMKE